MEVRSRRILARYADYLPLWLFLWFSFSLRCRELSWFCQNFRWVGTKFQRLGKSRSYLVQNLCVSELWPLKKVFYCLWVRTLALMGTLKWSNRMESNHLSNAMTPIGCVPIVRLDLMLPRSKKIYYWFRSQAKSYSHSCHVIYKKNLKVTKTVTVRMQPKFRTGFKKSTWL